MHQNTNVGVLEIVEGGIGFLRGPTLLPSPEDIYVSQSQIHEVGLRRGDMVEGQIRSPDPSHGETYPSLLHIESVNDDPPDAIKARPRFHEMVTVEPHKLYDLSGCGVTPSLITLITPFGRGQRGLLVGPPEAGKTVIMLTVANALTTQYPNVVVIAALIGERPEEITRFRRETSAEIYSADFDAKPDDQVRVARLALERAKRLAEMKKNVVVLWDGITRTTRAYNVVAPPSGKTQSGGIEPTALHGPLSPKGMFGTARALEEGGSVAIFATCLVDTGSRMDDVIYEEFKGTGNMQLSLDRRWAERGVWPAFDFHASGTRRDGLLLDQKTRIWRKIIFTLFRLQGWGSEWTRRATLFEIVGREPTWPKVGLALLQHVLRRHPGAAQTFLGRLSSSATRTLFTEIQEQMTKEQRQTFEALGKEVP